jgi:hypothetical protein
MNKYINKETHLIHEYIYIYCIYYTHKLLKCTHYVCPGVRPEVSRLYHWFVLFSLILAAAWLGSRYSSDVNDEAYG